MLERAQILAEDNLITWTTCPTGCTWPPPVWRPVARIALTLDEQERRVVQHALDAAEGNKVYAAELLGISRRALYRLIIKHDLARIVAQANAPNTGT